MSDRQKNKLTNFDKFYTNQDIADIILIFLKNFIEKNNIYFEDISFLEPSAGSGSFINSISKIYPNSRITAFDIHPENKRIEKFNFLKLSPSYSKNLITIGNPPFGYKGNLASQFINRSSLWSDIIIFILPLTFRRYSVQKKISKNLKLIYSSENLPSDSFNFGNKKVNINCLVQIWVNANSEKFSKFNDLRIKTPPKNKHEDFRIFLHNNTKETLKYFDKKKYKWDFAVVRQGFYDYSQRITSEEKLNSRRQYVFIKYINPDSEKIFSLIDFEKLSKTGTTIKGFSNTDLVKEYDLIKNKLTSI